jgi:PPOX class probable F420-dependent enzyme
MARLVFADWERDLLVELKVARFGTVGVGGRPHLVPVCYAAVGGAFAIAVDEKPKRNTALARLHNIAADSRVSLLFDRYEDDWSRLAWVRVDGEARVLDRGELWPPALAALRERYPQYSQMGLEELPLVVVRATNITSWRWSS